MKQTVLLYNVKGTKKGKELAMIFSYLGFRVRQVDKADYGLPIGDLLAGKTTSDAQADARSDAQAGEEAPAQPAPDAAPENDGAPADFSDEMLVFDGASDDTLNKALYMMRKQGVPVDLKAVATQNNRQWSSVQLHTEISKEHEAMKGNR